MLYGCIGFLALPTLALLFDNFPIFFQDFFFHFQVPKLNNDSSFYIASFINSLALEQYHKVVLTYKK